MVEEGATLIVLLIVLSLGLIIPELLKKFRIPLITLIILAGSIFGPYGFGYVEVNPILSFFGFLGMTFLMLMAGLETDISKTYHSKYKILTLALFNGFIPFVTGFLITMLFGYSVITSLLIGVIFISSSVHVIIPSLHKNKGDKNKWTIQVILSAVMFADIVSLIAMGIIFQNIEPITSFPLPLYFASLIALITFLFLFMPKLTNYFMQHNFSGEDSYERGIRFVLVVIIGSLSLFTILGVHPIMAAFLTGLSLSGFVMKDKTKKIYHKLHTLGFGLFVPVFFFIVGMEMDLTMLQRFNVSDLLMISLIVGLILSKVFSGYIGGRIIKMPKEDALKFGIISMTQLTTTLAVTYTASSMGIIDSNITTSIILLAIITTFLGPTVVSYLNSRDEKKK